MGSFKATLPRANPPVCWICDKRLYANGRIYAMVEIDGFQRHCHEHCAKIGKPFDSEE